MSGMRSVKAAKRSALGAALLASAIAVSPFIRAETKSELPQGASFAQSTGESKRNTVAAIAFVGGAICLGFAVKELKKVSKKD